MGPVFTFCPACGGKEIIFHPPKKHVCHGCGFHFYQNTAATASIIFTVGDKILLVRRGKEPSKGKLDIVGGFVDNGESLEEAAIRECREELDIHIRTAELTYFGSCPNTYLYQTIEYSTCDSFFISSIPEEIFSQIIIDKDEIESAELFEPEKIPFDDIAFPSIRRILSRYIDAQ